MSWLECLLPYPIPKEYGGLTIISLLESLFLLPLFACAFLFLMLCIRIVIYHVIYLRRPGRGKEYDLTEKLYVITGGTSGIGRQLAREIFSRNGSVILIARNPFVAADVRQALREEFPRSSGSIVPVIADLENLATMRRAADTIMRTYDRIDGLVCNAGIGSRANYEATVDGFETVIQTNCLGHALLTTVLSWGLQLTNGVVINVSSHVAHDTIPFDYENPFFDPGNYDGYQAYCRSKLMVNTFTMQAAKTTPEVCYLAVYPGIVFTKIGDQFVRSRSRIPALLPYILPITRTIFWLVGRTVKQGAETIWPLLVDPELRPPSGFAVDTRFRGIRGDRLNKEKMDGPQLEAMRHALNTAIAQAIDKYVHPDNMADKPPSPEGVEEDMPMEDTPEEESDVSMSFSFTRRLSKRKDKIVQSIKGLARRSIRRESSSEVLEDDSKTEQETKGSNDKKKKESDSQKPIRRIFAPDELDLVHEEQPKTVEKEKKKPILNSGPTATASRAATRRMENAAQTKKNDAKVVDSKKNRRRTVIPELAKDSEKEPKKTTRFRTISDNFEQVQGRERRAAERHNKIEEEDEVTSDEKKIQASGTPLGSVSRFRVGSAESLDGRE